MDNNQYQTLVGMVAGSSEPSLGDISLLNALVLINRPTAIYGCWDSLLAALEISYNQSAYLSNIRKKAIDARTELVLMIKSTASFPIDRATTLVKTSNLLTYECSKFPQVRVLAAYVRYLMNGNLIGFRSNVRPNVPSQLRQTMPMQVDYLGNDITEPLAEVLHYLQSDWFITPVVTDVVPTSEVVEDKSRFSVRIGLIVYVLLSIVGCGVLLSFVANSDGFQTEKVEEQRN